MYIHFCLHDVCCNCTCHIHVVKEKSASLVNRKHWAYEHVFTQNPFDVVKLVFMPREGDRDLTLAERSASIVWHHRICLDPLTRISQSCTCVVSQIRVKWITCMYYALSFCRSDLFFHDYSLAPLFVQENYPSVRPLQAKWVLLPRDPQCVKFCPPPNCLKLQLFPPPPWF